MGENAGGVLAYDGRRSSVGGAAAECKASGSSGAGGGQRRAGRGGERAAPHVRKQTRRVGTVGLGKRFGRVGGQERAGVKAALREQMWLCNLVHFVPTWLRERIWGAGILFPQRCGNGISFGGEHDFLMSSETQLAENNPDTANPVLKEQVQKIRASLNIPSEEPFPIAVGFLGWVLDRTETYDDLHLIAVVDEIPAAVCSAEDPRHAALEGVDAVGSVQQIYISNQQRTRLVAAAGGISTGAHIASLLTISADGVLLGTRLLFTPECEYTDAKEQALIKTDLTATGRTVAFDDRTMKIVSRQESDQTSAKEGKKDSTQTDHITTPIICALMTFASTN
ncbi:hypothetical protein B0H13DRAFT_2275682 [Mycena leptocephala]|nr:hypothetical protein B0H13DRAFT_2275682 [Mycena leptocephala]